MKKHLLKLWILLLFVAAVFALPMTAQAETPEVLSAGNCLYFTIYRRWFQGGNYIK